MDDDDYDNDDSDECYDDSDECYDDDDEFIYIRVLIYHDVGLTLIWHVRDVLLVLMLQMCRSCTSSTLGMDTKPFITESQST